MTGKVISLYLLPCLWFGTCRNWIIWIILILLKKWCLVSLLTQYFFLIHSNIWCVDWNSNNNTAQHTDQRSDNNTDQNTDKSNDNSSSNILFLLFFTSWYTNQKCRFITSTVFFTSPDELTELAAIESTECSPSWWPIAFIELWNSTTFLTPLDCPTRYTKLNNGSNNINELMELVGIESTGYLIVRRKSILVLFVFRNCYTQMV